MKLRRFNYDLIYEATINLFSIPPPTSFHQFRVINFYNLRIQM